MKKLIAAGGVGAWAAILALSWWLADRRISICDRHSATSTAALRCELSATAARDAILIDGLMLALIVAVMAAFAWLLFGSHSAPVRALRVRQLPKPSPSPAQIIGAVAALFGMIALLYLIIPPLRATPARRTLTPVTGNPFADTPVAADDPYAALGKPITAGDPADPSDEAGHAPPAGEGADDEATSDDPSADKTKDGE